MQSPERTFGRYQLLSILGEGGFATVYRARDPLLGRDVALKALLPHLAAHPEVRERFLMEARALAQLRHPNIVTFFDVGEVDGRPFITMELIDGATLADLTAEGAGLDPIWVADIIRSLGSALDYLHAAGLVHRDLKPTNVMLDDGGRVVLMDFGIVRALDQTGYTRTGAFLGTPEYMAPEQVRNQEVGPAADVYALGMLAYHLLAGRPAFTGDSLAVVHAHVYEPPPPLRDVRPDLPAHVYAAVDAALRKDPAARPRSAGDFAAALTDPARTVPLAPVAPAESSPNPSAWPPRRPGPLLAVVAAALVVALLGLLALMRFRAVETGTASQASGIAADLAAAAGATPSPSPSPSPVPRPHVADFKVFDSVYGARQDEFPVGQSITACYVLTPGGDGRTLNLVVTDRDVAPREPDATGVVGRTDVPNSAGLRCFEVNLQPQPLPPAQYHVWLLYGADVLQQGRFRAVPPPTPTPTPTPVPVAPTPCRSLELPVNRGGSPVVPLALLGCGIGLRRLLRLGRDLAVSIAVVVAIVTVIALLSNFQDPTAYDVLGQSVPPPRATPNSAALTPFPAAARPGSPSGTAPPAATAPPRPTPPPTPIRTTAPTPRPPTPAPQPTAAPPAPPMPPPPAPVVVPPAPVVTAPPARPPAPPPVAPPPAAPVRSGPC